MSKTLARIKAAMLAAQSLGDLYVLIEDHSYAELMQSYDQLTPQAQAKLEQLCDRDTQQQLDQLKIKNEFNF